jgi:thymidylate synthase (FAD)
MIFVTANARALRHFIEMRANEWADVEIRKVALAILRIMQKEAPSMFGDYAVVELADGTEVARTPHEKV